MPQTDPAASIQARIEELRQSTQPQRDRIAEIQSKAAEDVATITSEIEESDAEIHRLELALSALRGELPSSTREARSSSSKRSRRGRLPDVNVSPDDVIAYLKRSEEPKSAAEIREGLGIDPDVPGNKVSIFLGGLVETEQIGKQGEKRGTRYLAL